MYYTLLVNNYFCQVRTYTIIIMKCILILLFLTSIGFAQDINKLDENTKFDVILQKK